MKGRAFSVFWERLSGGHLLCTDGFHLGENIGRPAFQLTAGSVGMTAAAQTGADSGSIVSAACPNRYTAVVRGSFPYHNTDFNPFYLFHDNIQTFQL